MTRTASMRYPNEATMFMFVALVSAGTWLYACLSLERFATLLVAAIGQWVGLNLLIARATGASVRVSERQLAPVWAAYHRVAARLGVLSPPPLYVRQENGLLNAFAIRLARRRQVVITESLLVACDEDVEALEFVLGHELGHHLARHALFLKNLMLLPLDLVILGGLLHVGLSRMQEFTADRYGLAGSVGLDAAERGLKTLIAGKYGKVVATDELTRQWKEESGFWSTVVELISTHPNPIRRITALREVAGVTSAGANSNPQRAAA